MKQVKTQGNSVVYEGEARRAAFAMESDVRLFQGCNRLLAAAKGVVGNWEQGDLAAAVRYLDLSVKETEDDMDGTPREVMVLIIEYRNGRNIYVCGSEDRAKGELYSFVEEYWSELPGDVGKIPAERLDAIETYFEEKDGEESYEILTLPILSTKVETYLSEKKNNTIIAD
jgi:hypothetical protein